MGKSKRPTVKEIAKKLEEEIKRRIKEAENMGEALNSMFEENSGLKKRINRLEEENQALSSEYDSCKERYLDLRGENESLTAILEELRKIISQLLKERGVEVSGSGNNVKIFTNPNDDVGDGED